MLIEKVIKMKKYNTVIFDLDGTLLDSLDDLTAAINYVMGKHGYPEHTREAVRGFVGNGVVRLLECAVPNGKENPDFDACLSEYRAYYESHAMVHTRPYDGVMNLLETLLKDGCKVAVVSNKQDAAVKSLCAQCFPSIHCAMGEMESRGIRRKPYPDMVIETIKQLGSVKERCCYIGDSEVDIETAKNTGIDCISVTWGFREADFLRKQGASMIADNADEVLALLNA